MEHSEVWAGTAEYYRSPVESVLVQQNTIEALGGGAVLVQ